MKQAINFRLNKESIAILALLEKELDTSKTDVIEQALRSFAKKKHLAQQPLLEYAGKLNKDDAEDMLKSIRSSKRNKDIDIEL